MGNNQEAGGIIIKLIMIRKQVKEPLMNAYKQSVTLNEHGKLVLNGLPFHAGETVEVIILEQSKTQNNFQSSSFESPLQGTVIRYDKPFEPAVSPEEWEALQ